MARRRAPKFEYDNDGSLTMHTDRGDSYVYYGVDEDILDEMRDSRTPGNVFNRYGVKENHDWDRVPGIMDAIDWNTVFRRGFLLVAWILLCLSLYWSVDKGWNPVFADWKISHGGFVVFLVNLFSFVVYSSPFAGAIFLKVSNLTDAGDALLYSLSAWLILSAWPLSGGPEGQPIYAIVAVAVGIYTFISARKYQDHEWSFLGIRHSD
jgi:hypothetical protein